MVSTTESVGRLIAEEVLLQSDRKLVLNRDQPDQRQKEQPAPPAPTPISHNDKAVASVLLTLLDEQIEASADKATDSLFNSSIPHSSGDEAALAANRVAAHYVETDAMLRADPPKPQPDLPANTNTPQFLLAAASPELRMAMQSTLLTAAVRVQTDPTKISDATSWIRKITDSAESGSLLRIGLGISAVAALAISIAAVLAR
jgi:hypothetical protein